VIDFEAVIRHFGPQAVSLLLSSKWKDADNKAAQALRTQSTPDRPKEIINWLRSYAVFQGITSPERHAIATAVLRWADSRGEGGRLTTVDDICQAHDSLKEDCVKAYGKKRDFTSLASKALWLRYPDDVPIFDSFAQRTLWMFSKLENGITPLAGKVSEYRQFVHIWRAFYEQYKAAIADIVPENYPYPVRVFDVILWIVGSPGY
jgi:hypothetical protein